MAFSYQSTVKGAVPIAGSLVNPSGIAVVDFAIPAKVRRITLLSNGLISTGAIVRLGTSSGVVATGYSTISSYLGPSTGSATGNAGFSVPKCSDVNLASFCMTFYRVSPNGWNSTGQARDIQDYCLFTISNVFLSGELTTFRYINPTTMTSGSLQLLWEF